MFTANAAWLVLATIAFNLTRAAAVITSTDLSTGENQWAREFDRPLPEGRQWV